MRRVPEVIDVWFDSGAMPFAQYHAPFENEERFRERFPADFVCEALDQTRGWFYSLLAISTLLFEPRALSQRRLPRPDPRRRGPEDVEVEGQRRRALGGDLDATAPTRSAGTCSRRRPLGTAIASRTDAIGEQVRLFLKPLWSTYYFYVLYARANEPALREARGRADASGSHGSTSIAGRSRAPRATAELVAERLDAYDATTAGRAIAELLDDLSNWYVRRTRRRFWDGDALAFRTLRECLLTLARVLAPFCPFISDEIYDNLDGARPSVHLCDFPLGGSLPARDAELEEAMASRARDGPPRARRAREGEDQDPPATRRGRRRGRRLRARRDRTARGDRAR